MGVENRKIRSIGDIHSATESGVVASFQKLFGTPEGKMAAQVEATAIKLEAGLEQIKAQRAAAGKSTDISTGDLKWQAALLPGTEVLADLGFKGAQQAVGEANAARGILSGMHQLSALRLQQEAAKRTQ
jgi:hypothetical protein